MLISKVLDEAGSEKRAEGAGHGPEYQTASELFDLMTRKAHLDSTDDDSLTARDLVLLYKNIDIGTKLMKDATGLNLKKSNQYVETIVYNDERESESDLSDIYSTDDMRNVFMVNQERLDFFNASSLENLLCHKFGGLEIQTSEMSTEYDRNFLFKDPYIKNQLKDLNIMTSSNKFGTLFPTSLLDYICCQRLEDNYSFYMDNIIRYVQHTIEQLKRISNGDYLTDRAKEKWREVNSIHQELNAKVLATSTSIPLHVECKQTGNATWDDIVHSEMDVRSLSKILKKKIVVEIPKLICGSYRLCSKRCADNLIISCHKEEQKIEKKSQESRVNVVLQLQRSQTGQVMSNISSIMILRTSSALPDICCNEILPVAYHEPNDERDLSTIEPKELSVTVIATNDNTDVVPAELETKTTPRETVEQETIELEESQNGDSIVETNGYPFSDRHLSCDQVSCPCSSESSIAFKEFIENPVFPLSYETAYNGISPDELRMSMQRLNMQISVLDESVEDLMSQSTSKKKSPVRVRIKSPYENKSFLLEEKKRKRLLEIREKREKKKLALGENCKISKHKYGKGAILPQASSSVTKLSITNKSFYNSIYGQSLSIENKMSKSRKNPRNNNLNDLAPLEQIQKIYFDSPIMTPERNSKKYTNRSYYLDDAETEMMHMQLKLNENKDGNVTCSASNSAVSNELNEKLDLLKSLISPADTNHDNENYYLNAEKPDSLVEISYSGEESLLTLPLAECAVPTNTANEAELVSKKVSTGDECRKSIDQLYDLIKKFGKPNTTTEVNKTKSKLTTNVDTGDGVGGSSIQGSDSGTSVKHHITSSNHSGFSADKNITITSQSNKNQATVVPKVIISSKLQSPKIEVDKAKKDRKKSLISPSYKSTPDNPLKAISQLLHEFDNVQKTRQKPPPETKLLKKMDVLPNDIKNISRQPSYKRRSRLEQHLNNDPEKKVTPGYNNNPKDRRTRYTPPIEHPRIPHQQTHVDDKNIDKITKKKIADIIDEAKEARGEAVRGPPKFNSRLNNLAQPKKSYVQAHHEEYQNRYGRNNLAERLQKLAGAPSSPTLADRVIVPPTTRNKLRRYGTEATSAASVKPPTLDRGAKSMSYASGSSSPNRQHPWQAPGVQKHSQPEAPDAIKKMVAVESYLKSHYGRSTGTSPLRELLQSALKSRVPLVPQDLELASSSSSLPEEAKELGHTLHRMIDGVVGKCPLTSLAECAESTSKPSLSELSVASAPHSECHFQHDLLEDSGLKTAVESIPDVSKDDVDENNVLHNTPVSNSGLNLLPLNSTTELQNLENALYSQISGAFQKRLRMKNLTLTPKQSVQQVFLVQTGDASPLLVKSSFSNLKVNKCGTKSLHELKVMPVLSKSHLDWTFAQIPLQITTVGYSFSKHQTSPNDAPSSAANLLAVPSIECSKHVDKGTSSSQAKLLEHVEKSTLVDKGTSNSRVKLLEVPSVESFKHIDKGASISQTYLLEVPNIESSENTIEVVGPSKKINQCFKEVLQNPVTETGTQIDVVKKFVAKSLAVSIENIIGQEVNSQTPAEIEKSKNSNESYDNLENVNEIENATTTTTDNSDKAPDELSDLVIGEEAEKETIATGASSNNFAPNQGAVDYTTSLDMLVGILNEIQKITCQNQMVTVNDYVTYSDSETIHKGPREITGRNTSCDIISISSLDNLRQLESNGSIYSFYISNNGISENSVDPVTEDNIEVKMTDVTHHKEAGNMAILVCKPASLDKEVSANICAYADASPRPPAAVLHTACVSSCGVGVVSEPSGPVRSLLDYQNAMFKNPAVSIIEGPQIEVKHKRELISRDKTDLNKKCFKSSFSLIHTIEDVKNDRSLIARSELRKYCVNNIDFDPMLHVKRDILVTVYSILVFTVFAALSFPELIMFQ